MVLAKTIGVLLMIGLALWVICAVIGFLAATFWTILEFLVVAAIIGAVYHHFKHQKAHGT